MQKISKAKIIKIQTLISRQDLRDEKEALVRSVSANSKTSVADLTRDEADTLIALLEGNTPPTDDPCDAMRKKAMYYGYMLHWDEPRNDNQKRMTASQICFTNVSAFAQSEKSAVRVPLQKMDHQQLKTFVSQLEKIYKKATESLAKP